MPAPRGDKWEEWVEEQIALIKRLLRRPFDGTGMHPNGAGGLDSDTFEAGVSGFSLRGSDGNAEFNDLTLRGGIIGNDALTNPVVPASVWEEASNFTVSPTWNTIINKNVVIPADITSAVVSAKARATAFMNQDSVDNVDYLYAQLYVAGNASDYYPLAVTDLGGSGTNHVFRDVVLTGLTPGNNLNLQLQVATGFETWTSPSSPGNTAKLGASILWFR